MTWWPYEKPHVAIVLGVLYDAKCEAINKRHEDGCLYGEEKAPLFLGDLLEFGASYREKFQCHKKLHRLMILPPYHYTIDADALQFIFFAYHHSININSH